MSTGISTLPAPTERTSLLPQIADFIALSKPKIVILELVAVLATLHIATRYGAAGTPWTAALVASVMFGTALVAASANTMNMWLERELDAQMPRTAERPLPAGRITPAEALAFGLLTLTAGVTMLAMHAGLLPSLIALGTWGIYVGCYTPLKPRSWINTAVGAVSGATPLWIGWTAGGGSLLDPLGIAIVAVMYVWQFPHFMAIAWLSRAGYAAAGHQMSTVLDPSGRWAGFQAVVWSAVLLPMSLAPIVLSTTIAPLWYGIPVTLAGLVMFASSQRFLTDCSDITARRLLRVTLLYVPVWLLALWVAGA
ncbi:protoheme IX farnesyltransferase [Botrimarina hoheduenensis]|uniref:Protoheme IX farnesyltransferase n=1 Tax=Botrimarina hoheduenensis TaxID=2528000 RepID=A0A5C5VW71_9BACT|nr:protoheme IX farnesyltransferase [Botrimarina hoheduenensis]TWT42868.1 Protoheme IX farnesyltransferase 2 [Botrimarina hoheduenensis]